jgi:hypothetical protein
MVAVVSVVSPRCLVAHTAGVFANDFAAGDWIFVLSQAFVTGPAVSVAGNVPKFHDTTGLALDDSGVPVASLAPQASPALTRVPVAPTAAPGTNSTQTAMVLAQAASATPLINATVAVVGTSTRFARGDHVHPTDTTRQALLTAGQLPGTATNDNATTGNVGESVDGAVVTGSAVSLVTGTPKTVVSIPVPAGDWEIDCNAYFNAGGTTVVTSMTVSISLVTNTLDLTAGRWGQQVCNLTGPPTLNASVPSARFNFATTTTVFLVVQSGFTTSTQAAWGNIHARRPR